MLLITSIVFYIFPKNVKYYSLYASLFCLSSIVLYYFRKVNLALVILFSLILCTPNFNINEAPNDIIYRMPYFLYGSFLCFIIIDSFFLKRALKFDNIVIINSVIVLFIEFLQYTFSFNETFIPFRVLFFNVLGVNVVFLFTYNSGISFKSFIRVLFVTFLPVLVYTILQNFYQFSIYTPITSVDLFANKDISNFRAFALFGHPLVLSAYLCFMFSIIIAAGFVSRKINYIFLILIIFCSLLTVSRTPIIIIGAISLFYIILSIRKFSLKQIFIFSLALVLATLVLENFFIDFVDNIILRFQTEKNVSHRFGAYFTGYNVIVDNLFGLGSEDIMIKIRQGHYNAPGFWAYFSTIDSFYVSMVASYGILSFFYFRFFFQFLFKSFSLHHKSVNIFYAVIIIYVCFSLIGFSFDLQSYVIILFLLAFSMGIIFNKKNRLIIK